MAWKTLEFVEDGPAVTEGSIPDPAPARPSRPYPRAQPSREVPGPSHRHDVPVAEILKQLEAITGSSLFSKSKRYPNFLRYIVEHTLTGRTELLKERTLGIEVFHRSSNYDTNADPVVRITAGEIRKRLAQYYQLPGHEHELRVDLPVGSYAPTFSRPTQPSTLSADPELAVTAASVSDALAVPSLPEPSNPPEAQVLPGEVPRSRNPHPPMLPEPDLPQPDLPPPHLSVLTVDPRGHRELRRFAARLAALMLLILAALGTAGYALTAAWQHARERGIAALWMPVFHSENPALIVMGVHSVGPDGRDVALTAPGDAKQSMLSSMIRVNMVPVSDVASYSQITDLLVGHAHPYHTQSSTETTFSQLQPGPVILVGGLDNAWTLRLTAPLRYHFDGPDCPESAIVDAAHPGTGWRFNNAQSAHSNSRDYALVASFFDPQIEQRVVVAAGIGKSGTAAAASFLTTNRYLQGWLSQAKLAKGGNVELVIATEIVEGQQGPPRIVAGYTW